MGGSQWDWSRGIWLTARYSEAISGTEPDHEGSIPIPTQNELIILVLPQQFYQQNAFIMMQNICFCLKGQCISKLSAIFVVLIMWHKLDPTNQSASRKNILLELLPCRCIVPWDYYCPAGCCPMGLQPDDPQGIPIL